jgi:hypothetical protein
MDSLKSERLGKTALHGARVSDVSKASSAARRPWTVILPIGLEIDFGTVRRVRRAVVGTFRRVSPAWMRIRTVGLKDRHRPVDLEPKTEKGVRGVNSPRIFRKVKKQAKTLKSTNRDM